MRLLSMMAWKIGELWFTERELSGLAFHRIRGWRRITFDFHSQKTEKQKNSINGQSRRLERRWRRLTSLMTSMMCLAIARVNVQQNHNIRSKSQSCLFFRGELKKSYQSLHCARPKKCSTKKHCWNSAVISHIQVNENKSKCDIIIFFLKKLIR